MKKLIWTILILLVLAIGGSAYYFLKVKTYDISQDKELEAITEENYEIALPTDTNSNTSGENDPVEGNTEEDKESIDSGNSDGTSQSSANQKATVASIKEKYRPAFESLQAQANSKINALVAHAIQEYRDMRASGEEISYSYFLTKYKTAGEALEAKTDQAFETIFSALQEELKENGFDPNEANDVRDAYEAAKKERRKALLSSALEKF